jgi:ABC-type transport system involved in multi-copper enzyme maturation permease subunit
MKIPSKFRTLFLIRVNILFFIFYFFCLYILFSGFKNEDYEAIIGSVLFLALSIFIHILKLQTVNEIVVLEDGLQKITLLSGKVEFIPFSSIVNIQTERIQGSYSDAGQITTGYFESTILLENGTELFINPDYDNYMEIVVAIRHKI